MQIDTTANQRARARLFDLLRQGEQAKNPVFTGNGQTPRTVLPKDFEQLMAVALKSLEAGR